MSNNCDYADTGGTDTRHSLISGMWNDNGLEDEADDEMIALDTSNNRRFDSSLDERQEEENNTFDDINSRRINTPSGDDNRSDSSTVNTFIVYDLDTMEEKDIGDLKRKPRKKPKLKSVIFGLVFPIFILLFVAVFLSFYYYEQMSASSSSSSASAITSSTPTSSQATKTNSNSFDDFARDPSLLYTEFVEDSSSGIFLPDVPLHLEESCGIDSIQTTEGYQKCFNGCKVSHCCNYPISLDASCLSDNKSKCWNYHKICSNIIDLGGDLKEVTTLPQKQQQQQELLFIPPPPDNIQTICSHDELMFMPGGFMDCEQACEDAKCCYLKNDELQDGMQTCTSNPSCEGYAQCLILSALRHVDIQITQEIDKKCSTDQILTLYGRYDCLTSCSHALCCFVDRASVGGACRTENQNNGADNENNNSYYVDDFCLQYSSCQNVYTVTEEQIDTFCDPDTGDTGVCMQLCFPARCCFDSDPGNCADGFDEADCPTYKNCESFFVDSSASTTIAGTLTSDSSSSPHSSSFSNNVADVKNSLDGELFYSVDQIRDACLNHNNDGANTGRKTLCEVECEPAKCCFDENASVPVSTCTYEENTVVDCNLYGPCSILHNHVEEESIQGRLERVCDQDFVANDGTFCVELCSDAACCFTNDPSRSCLEIGSDNIICSQYQACDIIYYNDNA